ncbi:MAG: TAT-variant-translocated molybdopterin oxidoreductase [Planctomycetota bacterium]
MNAAKEIENSSAIPLEPVAATRAKLEGLRGRDLWRSLEELAGTPQFEEMIRREYPSQLHKFMDLPERREFLKYMGASLALAGIGASCARQPEEKIYPYAKSPEKTIPGKPLYFATSMPWPRGAIGLLVESHEGRPTKVEGNPDHPASLGATDAFAQASILGLYDPDRSKAIKRRGRIATWDDFLTALKAALTAQAAKKGAGLRILTETVTSPTLAAQIQEVLALYPEAKWHEWEPADAGRPKLGDDGHALPQIERAQVILSIDDDFLGLGPDSVRKTKMFASRRRGREGATEMNRLYVVETAMTATGAMADHRLALRPTEIVDFSRMLASRIESRESIKDPATRLERWIEVVAEDLQRHGGSSLVLAGNHLPRAALDAADSVNQRLENHRQAIAYSRRREGDLASESIDSLVADMNGGRVETLVILGGNPVYNAPADLEFSRAIGQVGFRVHLSTCEDESSDLCDWHVNEAHFLESWSDALAPDGTVGIVQPLIAPLYAGKTAHEMLAAMAGQGGVSSYQLVHDHVMARHPSGEFEANWRRSLHDGLIRSTQFDLLGGSARTGSIGDSSAGLAGELEIVFRPDPTIWDGRFANNGWLQELPKPITKLTWDNTAQVSPATAQRLGVGNEDVVELELDGRKVRAPIWIVPGQADQTVVVHLGYGRTKGGRLAEGAGFNAYLLRTTKAMWSAPGLKVTKTGDKQKLSSTQEHDRMEGRDLIRVATIDRFRENPKLVEEHAGADAHGAPVLHTFENTSPNAWGMVIDLNACTACGACVTACQAENNIPIVGREEVRRGREMHWIRIDRYFEGDPAQPQVHHQPIPCMHCENAPCETVCPVGATTHSPDGLNEMTYNRCVGTRYCSNNCPYKVRRFNFLLYQDFETEVLKLGRNPDVSVRSRGVMEKCTYCVQRISQARIQAGKEDRPIRDGDVRTACQQVCPAEAIVFGDILDPASEVSKLKAQPHEYGILEELNVRPRTTYLAKLKNPNPELEG